MSPNMTMEHPVHVLRNATTMTAALAEGKEQVAADVVFRLRDPALSPSPPSPSSLSSRPARDDSPPPVNPTKNIYVRPEDECTRSVSSPIPLAMRLADQRVTKPPPPLMPLFDDDKEESSSSKSSKNEAFYAPTIKLRPRMTMVAASASTFGTALLGAATFRAPPPPRETTPCDAESNKSHVARDHHCGILHHGAASPTECTNPFDENAQNQAENSTFGPNLVNSFEKSAFQTPPPAVSRHNGEISDLTTPSTPSTTEENDDNDKEHIVNGGKDKDVVFPWEAFGKNSLKRKAAPSAAGESTTASISLLESSGDRRRRKSSLSPSLFFLAVPKELTTTHFDIEGTPTAARPPSAMGRTLLRPRRRRVVAERA